MRASEALESLRRGERWDVILCDLMMPEMNGMEFVAEARLIDEAILSRVVVMSGGAFTPGAREFLRAWPHAQLEKPIEPELLLATVAGYINRADAALTEG